MQLSLQKHTPESAFRFAAMVVDACARPLAANHKRVKFEIGTTSREICEILARLFGGRISRRGELWVWQHWGKATIWLLHNILPLVKDHKVLIQTALSNPGEINNCESFSSQDTPLELKTPEETSVFADTLPVVAQTLRRNKVAIANRLFKKASLREHEAILLHYVDGRTLAETSERMGVKNANAYIRRARRKAE